VQFFKTPNINFIGRRRTTLIASAILIVAGLASIAIQRGLNMSIDFAGGAMVEVRTETAVPLQDIRTIVSNAGFAGAEITRYGADNDYMVKVKSVANADTTAKMIVAAIRQGVGSNPVDLRRVETVGPKLGADLRTSALWAMFYSFLGILIYVGWRFDFRFASASIIATLHDVLVTLALFSFAGMEMSLTVLAAFLTIVGYSINDKIVIFDRIRENLHLRRREDFDTLVNTSINETLSRTVITGSTTLLALLSLIILGGEVIRDFALVLFVGIIVGTYSSVCIGAPVVVEWNHWRPMKSKK
jgi:preprotein translocase subunit SecF